MTGTGTDYRPGDAPVPEGTEVLYLGSHANGPGRYAVQAHQDPAEHPVRTAEEMALADAYPDGVAYVLWPVGVPVSLGNHDRAVYWAKRRSFRVVSVGSADEGGEGVKRRKPYSKAAEWKGRVPGVPGPVVVAADAALPSDTSRDRYVALAYIATTGHYRSSSHYYPVWHERADPVVVTELRAVAYGLRMLYGSGVLKAGVPVRVEADSENALRYLRSWVSDPVGPLPPGYVPGRRAGGGGRSALETLRWYAEKFPDLEFVKVEAHAGEALNETADSLAKLALRFTRKQLTRQSGERVAALWAERGLEDYRRRAGGRAGAP